MTASATSGGSIPTIAYAQLHNRVAPLNGHLDSEMARQSQAAVNHCILRISLRALTKGDLE